MENLWNRRDWSVKRADEKIKGKKRGKRIGRRRTEDEG